MCDNQRQFKVIKDAQAADFSDVRVTLFASEGKMFGWYIGPVTADILYNVKSLSKNLPAYQAVIRAIELADNLGVKLCVVDPDGLWATVWPA